jgi:hypothetical protein
MTRHLVAASLAALMFAAPVVAFAQTDTPAASTDTAKKPMKHHKKKKAAPPASDSMSK